MFYWVYSENEDTNELPWFRVMSLNDQTNAVVNKLKFHNRTRIVEEYDMQGTHIVSISLSWIPYFSLYDCNAEGKECKSDGYLRAMMDALGSLMNFTWDCHQEINQDWGLTQYSSGEWGGVTGHVYNGSYPLSIR